MTLDWLDVDLAHCFSAGMVYTALSRCRGISGLRISSFAASRVSTNPRAREFMRYAAARAQGWRAIMHSICQRTATTNQAAMMEVESDPDEHDDE